MCSCYTLQTANKICADQTAHMHICCSHATQNDVVQILTPMWALNIGLETAVRGTKPPKPSDFISKIKHVEPISLFLLF